MIDAQLILQEQVFPTLVRIESGNLSGPEAFLALRGVIQSMLKAATLKRAQSSAPEALLIIDLVHEDLLTLDVILAQCGRPAPDGGLIAEPFLADFVRVLEAWSTDHGLAG